MSPTDAYLDALPDAPRRALIDLRQTILDAVPEAVEHFSYGMPAFRYAGASLVWMGASARHCALYGIPEAGLEDALAGYDTSGRGTLRFAPDAPLPPDLVRRLLAARIAQIDAS